MRKARLLLLLLALAAIAASTSWASPLDPWSGKCVGVSDGDTITVMRDGSGVKIRVAEVDTPEKAQPYGQAAKRFTSDLCFGKIVTVRPDTTDRYGRTVGHVALPGGGDLSTELIKAGLGWQYKKYSKSPMLAQLEQEARQARRGLWSEPNPTPPWEWRRAKAHGPRGPPASAVTTVSAQQTDSGGPYHGNIKSHKFHRPGCRYYNCKNCTAVFQTRQEAIQAGYVPCKVCGP